MAKRESNLLTDVLLRKWLRAGEPVSKPDGNGLTFTLSTAGTAAWVLRFRYGGRRQELTLGRYPDLSLSAARAATATLPVPAWRQELGAVAESEPTFRAVTGKPRSHASSVFPASCSLMPTTCPALSRWLSRKHLHRSLTVWG
ncbi:Arm DNA-binding domain-containing protein [Burkholderia stagnalis]